MKNKILYFFIAISTLLYAVDMPPMPPMVPTMKNKTTHAQSTKKQKKSSMPKSCGLIPPMVLLLPPPMEKDLVKCKNDLYKPKKEFVAKQLAKLFKKKKVNVTKIEIMEDFNQLYKVFYDKKVILVNKNVDAFIRQ